MKCFYHNDFDGHCAGAVVKWANPECEMIEVGYSTPFPFESVKEGEEVVIVDFSIQPAKDWAKLLERTQHVIWIDHHKTAIEDAEALQDSPNHALRMVSKLPGFRRIGDESGCSLAWQYCFPDVPMPYAVELVSDFDAWVFKHGDVTDCFICGLGCVDTDPVDDKVMDTFWVPLFEDTGLDDGPTKELVLMGHTAAAYRDGMYRDLAPSIYGMLWKGQRCLTLNGSVRSSIVFEKAVPEHLVSGNFSLMVVYSFNGKEWSVSLYSLDVDGWADAGALAKSMGGGGHKGASGFSSETFPFSGLDTFAL